MVVRTPCLVSTWCGRLTSYILIVDLPLLTPKNHCLYDFERIQVVNDYTNVNTENSSVRVYVRARPPDSTFAVQDDDVSVEDKYESPLQAALAGAVARKTSPQSVDLNTPSYRTRWSRELSFADLFGQSISITVLSYRCG